MYGWDVMMKEDGDELQARQEKGLIQKKKDFLETISQESNVRRLKLKRNLWRVYESVSTMLVLHGRLYRDDNNENKIHVLICQHQHGNLPGGTQQ
jgi:hypothetical protein